MAKEQPHSKPSVVPYHHQMYKHHVKLLGSHKAEAENYREKYPHIAAEHDAAALFHMQSAEFHKSHLPAHLAATATKKKKKKVKASSDVAATILAQLGGNKFLVMTGAKNLVKDNKSLSFDLPRGANKGINKFRITLSGDDTYKLEAFKYRKLELTPIASKSSITVEKLQRTFTDMTGLHTSL
jgi:hypothetical protein